MIEVDNTFLKDCILFFIGIILYSYITTEKLCLFYFVIAL